MGTFAPPAGTSVGKFEAKTASAQAAHEQVNRITPALKRIHAIDQQNLDEFLGGNTELSANASLAISVAYAIAANTLRIPGNAFKVPEMMVLFFEGGVHSSSHIGIQEFMSIYTDIFKAADDYNKIKKQLTQKKYFVNTGMEGAMVSEKISDIDALELLNGKNIALDMGGHYLDHSAALDIMALPEKYSIISIEDPYPENDIDNWRKFFQRWSRKILIVGDDLTATNKTRITKYAHNAINAVIIKPNQQRTLTDTLQAAQAAKNEGLKIIVSHRSGETNQTFIADLAVAIGADYVKFGAPVRGERVGKYNRLLELTSAEE